MSETSPEPAPQIIQQVPTVSLPLAFANEVLSVYYAWKSGRLGAPTTDLSPSGPPAPVGGGGPPSETLAQADEDLPDDDPVVIDLRGPSHTFSPDVYDLGPLAREEQEPKQTEPVEATAEST